MHYKLFKYSLARSDYREVLADEHFGFFDRSKGADSVGRYARYRGKHDAVLMFLRRYNTKFIGLIGRYSIERDVDIYDPEADIVNTQIVEDEDYPNTPFLCFPRIKMIACVDGGRIPALTAMRRLHQILASRQNLIFTFEEISQTFDLRKAINRFRVTRVDFEIFPVNPHSGDLGLEFDRSRKLDHIRKLKGVAEAPKSDPLKLEGGLLTAIQQLQKSGHCKLGFRGFTHGDVEVHVPKPSKLQKLADDESESVYGEESGVRISFPKTKLEYPFDEDHVLLVYKIAKQFLEIQSDEG